MTEKVYLNKKQRETVNSWLAGYDAKITRIRDASCRYREVWAQWSRSVDFPAFGKAAIVVYQSFLDLTPSGKIRIEQHQQKQAYWHKRERFSSNTQLAFPLPETLVLPPPPPNIVRRSLFPRDRTKPKIKKVKPVQFSLPLDESTAKLNAISIERGNSIESAEAIWSERTQYLDLDGRRIVLPKGFIDLLLSMNCSVTEFEVIAQFYQVLEPEKVLRIIEEIPFLRRHPEFPDFQEPVKVEVRKVQQSVQHQSITVHN